MNNQGFDVDNYSIDNVDNLIVRFQNAYKKQYFLFVFAAAVIFLAFYPTVLFEIPYTIKIYMFTGTTAVFFLWSMYATRKDTFELLTVLRKVEESGSKAANNRGKNTFLYVMLGIFLIAYIIVAFFDVIPSDGLLLLLAFLFLGAIVTFFSMCVKYIIRIKKNEAIDLYHGLYPELAIVIVFFVVLPVFIYPPIAERTYSFTFTSTIAVAEIKDKQTESEKKSVKLSTAEILKKYKCTDCSSKVPYVESEVTKTESGDSSIALTTKQIRNSAVVDSTYHQKAVSEVVDDFKKHGYVVEGNIGKMKAKSKQLPAPPKRPKTLPTMFTLLLFIYPLIAKLLQSKQLLDIKKHYSRISLQEDA